jgi:hypothetical protein
LSLEYYGKFPEFVSGISMSKYTSFIIFDNEPNIFLTTELESSPIFIWWPDNFYFSFQSTAFHKKQHFGPTLSLFLIPPIKASNI